jgi:HEAT repeat protein
MDMKSKRLHAAICVLGSSLLLGAPAWGAGPKGEILLAQQSPAPDQETAERDRAVWRAARESLRNEQYKKAQQQFADIIRNQPESRYVPESYYWRAYALYELGSHDELNQASESLQKLMQQYPEHRSVGEARELLVRVQGQLMNQHADRQAAESIYAFLEEWEKENADRDEDKGRSGCDDMQLIAVQSLMQMNPQRALPLLRRVIEDHSKCPELREKAIFVVSQLDEPESMQLILDAARNDPNPAVREQAVFWLSQVNAPEAVEALRHIAHDRSDPGVQEKAIFALSQHDSPQAAQTLEEIARDANNSIDVREKAIFWLGQRRDNVDFLMEIYGELQEPELREKVLFSISQTSSQRSGAWLRERALDANESRELRKKALFWLGQMGELSCTDLKTLYDEFQEREMREQLIFGLSQMNDSCATRTLIDIARSEKDPELREKAVFWLGQIGDDAALDYLEELINQ